MKKIFRIVPDPDHIGFWNVEEKRFFVFRTWMESYGEFEFNFVRRRLFPSIEDAKLLIDKAITPTKISENEKLNEWRKTEPIYYIP